jgi:hypothetical protein
MPAVTISWGSSISQHLRATKDILQDVDVDANYVWSGEILRIGGLKFQFAGLWRP